MEKAVFRNWTKDKFTYKWGGKNYTFEPGKVYKDVIDTDDGSHRELLTPGIAAHFAKHLAHHFIISKMDKKKAKKAEYQPIDIRRQDQIDEFTARALKDEPTPLAEVQEAPKKRIGRPKKVVEAPVTP